MRSFYTLRGKRTNISAAGLLFGFDVPAGYAAELWGLNVKTPYRDESYNLELGLFFSASGTFTSSADGVTSKTSQGDAAAPAAPGGLLIHTAYSAVGTLAADPFWSDIVPSMSGLQLQRIQEDVFEFPPSAKFYLSLLNAPGAAMDFTCVATMRLIG